MPLIKHSWYGIGPVHTAPHFNENRAKPIRFALHSHWHASNTELFEYGTYWIRSIFSVNTKYLKTFEYDGILSMEILVWKWDHEHHICSEKWKHFIVFIAYLLENGAVWSGTVFHLQIWRQTNIEMCERGHRQTKLIIIIIIYFWSGANVNCTVKTTGGTGNSGCCSFPFIYRGTPYHTCILQPGQSYWCGTTVNVDKDGQWGFCGSEFIITLIQQTRSLTLLYLCILLWP